MPSTTTSPSQPGGAGTRDFGPSKFGRYPRDAPRYSGRRVDLLGRSLRVEPGADLTEAIRRYLTVRRTRSAKELAAKAVVLIDPESRLGEIAWSGANHTSERTHMPPTGSSRIVAALASSSVGTPHGPVTLDGEAGRGSWRRGERELRPGCLDSAEARGRALGRPGARRPRAIGGTGTSPGSSSSRGSGRRRLGARNVGAAARRDRTLPAVTLSDTGVRGERAHSRRSARLSARSRRFPTPCRTG